ncbi:MAG: hypothetical protein QXJ62_06820 [Nitrososphaeria archaeon]
MPKFQTTLVKDTPLGNPGLNEIGVPTSDSSPVVVGVIERGVAFLLDNKW